MESRAPAVAIPARESALCIGGFPGLLLTEPRTDTPIPLINVRFFHRRNGLRSLPRFSTCELTGIFPRNDR